MTKSSQASSKSDDKVASFVASSRKKNKKEQSVEQLTPTELPWYKRPLDASEFTIRKGSDKAFYARHNEWPPRVNIGPYKTEKEASSVVSLYVEASIIKDKESLLGGKIHSVVIDDDNFFGKCKK